MVDYVVALGVTLLFEVPVYVLVMRAMGWASARAAWGLAIAINLVTHPVLYWFADGRTLAVILLAEVVVAAVEAAVIMAVVGRDRAWVVLTAVAANALSLGLGAIVLSAWGGLAGS